MKDGTTHLAYKPEHAVDLDTGAVVAAELHPADEGDTTTLSKTLAKAEANLEAVDAAPTSEDPAECVADKGYHSRAVLRALNESSWKTRIAAPKQTGFSRWHGDEAARRAVTNNRARLKSGVAREAFKLRAEIVERCFAHNLASGAEAQGQEAFQHGLGFEERPRGQDRQDEGRHDASGLQARAVARGVALSTVARMLGHSDPNMTLRYAHVSNRDVEAAAERIGKAIEAAMTGGQLPGPTDPTVQAGLCQPPVICTGLPTERVYPRAGGGTSIGAHTGQPQVGAHLSAAGVGPDAVQ